MIVGTYIDPAGLTIRNTLAGRSRNNCLLVIDEILYRFAGIIRHVNAVAIKHICIAVHGKLLGNLVAAFFQKQREVHVHGSRRTGAIYSAK